MNEMDEILRRLAIIEANETPDIKFGTPASAAAPGIKGQIMIDTGAIYICTATDTWKKISVATW